jgi:hypothetical protein
MYETKGVSLKVGDIVRYKDGSIYIIDKIYANEDLHCTTVYEADPGFRNHSLKAGFYVGSNNRISLSKLSEIGKD